MNSYEKRQRAQGAAAVVGVDAGKFQHALVVRCKDGADSKPVTFSTTREGFDSARERILALAGGASPEEILVGIEFAGSYGFTFAHYLHQHGFPVVSVLASDTKRWKEVAHHQALKTDAKDAIGITDLLAQGHFVQFPFLKPEYAELRYLVSAREHVTVLRNAALTRLKSVLEVVFPEYERIFVDFSGRTALALLRAFPGPDALLSAPKRRVLALLRKESQNHLGLERYDALIAAAHHTLALPGAQGALRDEVPLIIDRIALFEAQQEELKRRMITALEHVPEAEYLLTIPGVAAVSAATFLGSIGDPSSYESSRQVLRLAGLSLVERSSGTMKGKERISKRGRPTLRRFAFMLALKAARSDGIYRKDYERLLANNGGRKLPAIVAISRKMLRVMFSVAHERRPWTAQPRGASSIPVAGDGGGDARDVA